MIGVAAAAALTLGACGGSTLGGTGGAVGTGGGPATTGAGGFYPPVSTGGIAMGSGGVATGGRPGAGGWFGTGGVADTGGTYGTGGISGTGGVWDTGGTYGRGGNDGRPLFPDGGTCSAPDSGPISTSDVPRPFGWAFSGPTADAGAPATTGAGNDAGTGPARCQSVPAAYPGTSCVGSAVLRATAKGPTVTFADGSQLRWNGDLPAGLMPFVAGDAGDDVSVDYEKRINVVCPFCGAYTTETLQIRDGHRGGIRFYDQQGAVLPNLTDAQVMEIFGAPATAQQTCTFPAGAGCYTFLRSQFDHLLGTSPAQLIVDATLTQVTTPNGLFAVIWASSKESYVQQSPNCADGPGVASDTGFVATQLAPIR